MSETLQNEYDWRIRALEDATRLVREMHSPAFTAGNASTFTTTTVSRPPLELFDVLEVARFLLDEDDEPVCLSRSRSEPPAPCILPAGHDDVHRSQDGLAWGLR